MAGLGLALHLTFVARVTPSIPKFPRPLRGAMAIAALVAIAHSPLHIFYGAYLDAQPIEDVSYVTSIDTLKREYGIEFKTEFAPTQSATPKNLIIVFVESLDQSYLNQALYPGVTPHLNQLRESSLFMQDFRQHPFTHFTMAGMFAALCGLPFASDTGERGNDVMHYLSVDHLPCLGTVLNRLGYHQAFIQGSSTAFAGMKSLYRQMHYDEILGRNEIRKKHAHHFSDGESKWGFHDGDVLQFAFRRAEELHSRGDPFNITVATIDTHHPGWPAKSCPDYDHANAIVKAVHCIDSAIGKIIKDFRNSALYEDTVLLVMGDHLAMRPPVVVENRRVFASIVARDVPKRIITELTSHYDVSPTLFELLGVRGAKTPLGRSVLSSAPLSIDLSDRKMLRVFRPIISYRRSVDLRSDTLQIQRDPPRIFFKGRKRHLSFGNGNSNTWPKDSFHVLEVSSQGNIVRQASLPMDEALLSLRSKEAQSFLTGHLPQISASLGACAFGSLYSKNGSDIRLICPEADKRTELGLADIESAEIISLPELR
jgi:hypothetical protein